MEDALDKYASKEREAPAGNQAAPSVAPRRTSPSTKRPRTIVADGREWISQIAVILVREALPTAEIVATESGLEALHAITQGNADFLVTNHQPPGMDGATLIRHARARQPDLPIVMISVQPEARSEAIMAGANWFLPKNEIMERLPALLRAQIS